ncbi:hypothetical protein [Halobacteriovorax sp.]|uniref:hypothetical protein n=1 Tax=Halobacteriovorax sp. TaxID=2020862 RepID=UPI00356996B7
MKKCAAKLFLFLFVNCNIFALPGMNSISYDFSLNEEIFSQAAINCQTRPTTDVGLESISDFMNKMNCNSIKDPEKFCNCVSAISNKGAHLTDKEAVKIGLVVDEVSKAKVLESIAGSVEDIEGYDDLVTVLGSAYVGPKCLVTDNGNDPIFGEFQRKQRQGKILTSKDELSLKIFEKISSDIKNTKKLPLEDILSDAGYLKTLASDIDYRKSSGQVSLTDSNKYDLSVIQWDKVEDSAVMRLMRNDENLPNILASSIKSNHKKSAIQMSNATGAFMLGTLQSKLKVSLSKSSPYHKDVVQYSDGYDSIMVDSSISSACKKVRSEIDRLIRKSDVDKSVRSLRAAAFNPVTKEQKETFKIIEKEIASKLNGNLTKDEKSRVQNFIFDIDVLFCKERVDLKELKGKSNNIKIVDALEKEVLVVSTKLEIAKKDKLKNYNEFIRLSDELNKQIELENQKKRELELLTNIFNGEYSKRDGDSVIVDIKNEELISLAKKYSPNLALMIENANKQAFVQGVSFSTDELKIAIAYAEKEAKEAKLKIKSLENSFVDYDQKYRGSLGLVSQLEEDQDSVIKKLERAVGSAAALEIVVRTDREVDQKLGNKSSYELVFENEKRKSDKDFVKKSKSERFQSEVLAIATSVNDVQTEESSTREVIANVRPSEEIVTESVKEQEFTAPSSLSTDNRFSSNMMVNSQNTPVQNKQRQTVKTTPKSDKSNELENKIKELEELVAQNNQVTNTPEESSSIDSKIAELKEKINIEKIRSEKLKVTKELNELKNTKKETNTSVATQSTSEVSPLRSRIAATNSRSPSSSTRSSGGVSSAGVSSNSGANNFSSSSAIASSSDVGTPSTASRQVTESQNERAIDSNLDKSGLVSLDGAIRNESNSSSQIELVSYQGDVSELDSRVVKVDFNLSADDIENRTEVLESLFAEGEDEIVVLTLEGKKVIVKNKVKQTKKIEDQQKELERKNRKMRHQNLIDLLKVGQADALPMLDQ